MSKRIYFFSKSFLLRYGTSQSGLVVAFAIQIISFYLNKTRQPSDLPNQNDLSVKSNVSLFVSTFQVESKKRNFISILYQCKDNFIPHFTLEVPTLDRSWKNKIFLQLEKTDKSTGFQSLIHQFYSRSPKPGQLSLLPIYVTAKQGNKKFALKNQVHQIVEHLTRKCHVLYPHFEYRQDMLIWYLDHSTLWSLFGLS